MFHLTLAIPALAEEGEELALRHQDANCVIAPELRGKCTMVSILKVDAANAASLRAFAIRADAGRELTTDSRVVLREADTRITGLFPRLVIETVERDRSDDPLFAPRRERTRAFLGRGLPMTPLGKEACVPCCCC